MLKNLISWALVFAFIIGLPVVYANAQSSMTGVSIGTPSFWALDGTTLSPTDNTNWTVSIGKLAITGSIGSNSITLGDGSATTVAVTFDTDTTNGVLTYDDSLSPNQFKFSEGVLLDGSDLSFVNNNKRFECATASNDLTLTVDKGYGITVIEDIDISAADYAVVAPSSFSGGNFTVDSGTLFVDSANNKVAIGTTSAAAIDSQARFMTFGTGANINTAKVTDDETNSYSGFAASAFTTNLNMMAHGSTRIAQRMGMNVGGWSELRVANANTNGLMISVNAAKPILFGTTDTERMRIFADGTISIGTSTSYDDLVLANDANALQAIRIVGTRPIYRFHETDNNADENWQIDLDSGELRFQTNVDAFNSAKTMLTLEQDGDMILYGSSTATTTLAIGQTAGAKPGCLIMTDTDSDGYTYCTTLDGTMTCSTTACK